MIIMTSKLRTHWDADGVATAHFASFGIDDSEIEIGEYDKGFGDTSGLTKDDWILDMRPSDPKWDGNCIDHHLPHSEDRKYNLISDIVPATLIAWREYKDKIPKKEWWKAAIGICGDGQPELIPTEIFKETPALLKQVKTSAYNSYGKWNLSTFPLYKLLSSNINAFLRKGEYDSALSLIKYSGDPMDIYTSEDARIAKSDVKKDCKTAIQNCEMIDYGNLNVVIFYSKYRMSGYVSSTLQSSMNTKTIMAINKRNGSLSLRGDLAYYYRDILKPIKYLTIDGHPGFCGGKLKKNTNKFLDDLNQIL